MHHIEPHYNWQDYYNASEDEWSPFFGRDYDEFSYSNMIYNYYIHPQWDDFGSSTMYVKLLYTDYHSGYAVLELIGEWNDCLHNDIMFLKRNVISPLIEKNISKFILIGENVLNFHGSDDCYYEEWSEEVRDDGGWIAALNFREHVREEMIGTNISSYLALGEQVNCPNWRTFSPQAFCELVSEKLSRVLPASY